MSTIKKSSSFQDIADTIMPHVVPKSAKSNWGEIMIIVIVWYALSIGYNTYNTFMKPLMPFPWVIAFVQLPIGLIYAIPLWVLGYRKAPKLSLSDIVSILPIVACNCVGHCATVIAMFATGGASLTHVVKASEPVVVVLLNLLINWVAPKPFTALSLLPIVYGVSYAATLGDLNPTTMLKDLTTLTAKLAMVSNFAFAFRSILRKRLTPEFKARTNMDSDNEFAITTILTSIMVLPFALLSNKPSELQAHYMQMGETKRNEFLFNAILCGLCFYGYNEMQSKVLEKTDAVSMAVGNTLKRVAIFAGLFFFNGEAFPFQKTVGCAIAIAGCLAYGVLDSKKL